MDEDGSLKINLKLALVILSLSLTSFHSPVAPIKVVKVAYDNPKTIAMAKAIRTLSPHIKAEKALILSRLIDKHSEAYSIDGEIMLAIIQVESNFNQMAKSNTGDFSLAQINYRIWNEELLRLKKEPIDFKKLKTNPDYALKRMAEILSILSDRYESDPRWYARYHSKTPALKRKYAKKVEIHLDTIEKTMSQSLVSIENTKK